MSLLTIPVSDLAVNTVYINPDNDTHYKIMDIWLGPNKYNRRVVCEYKPFTTPRVYVIDVYDLECTLWVQNCIKLSDEGGNSR